MFFLLSDVGTYSIQYWVDDSKNELKSFLSGFFSSQNSIQYFDYKRKQLLYSISDPVEKQIMFNFVN